MGPSVPRPPKKEDGLRKVNFQRMLIKDKSRTCTCRTRLKRGLSAQLELLKNRRVTIEVGAFEVIKELAVTGRHGDQSTAGVKVLAVGAQMLG